MRAGDAAMANDDKNNATAGKVFLSFLGMLGFFVIPYLSVV